MSRRIPNGSVETFLEARELLAAIGPDLHADEHWIELGRAVGVVCKACDQQTAGRGLCDKHYRRHMRAHRNEAALINRQNRNQAS